jgi:type I restriction enzyme M protein
MDAIEKENPSLKGVLPKEYAKEKLDKQSLGGLIDIISTIALGDSVSRSNDVLGRVYEYFLGQFALAEGKKGGQFYTPRCVVQLLVEMLEPYEGRVLDPCCGSGGMFVQSEKFIEAHADHYKGKTKEIDKLFESVVSIYGQESNQTTWRLCKMNLALRGIDSSNVKWNSEGSFLNDAHTDLRADFVIANPPFNDSDWSGELLRTDGRWKYSRETPPPSGNANYAWIQHFVYHLNPKGTAGFVLAKGSLSSKTSGEDKIRTALIDAGLVDCIVNLPTKLFLNTQIPACLWFLSRAKESNPKHPRHDKILFIDARNKGTLINRRTRKLTESDIRTIAGTYRNWKSGKGYKDIPGFCKSALVADVAALDYVLTPGRYIGLPDDEDDFDFAERVRMLTAELEAQMKESVVIDKRIRVNLVKVEVPGNREGSQK